MELVYLWVKKYKNIHRQGFNFSARFKCDYNPDTNELIICDKNDPNCKNKKECKEFCSETYIENFFGENINITAIVGKNGSGKSSLLNAIINCKEEYFPIDTNYLLIYFDKEISCFTNIKLKKCSKKGELNLRVLVDRKDNDKNIAIIGGGNRNVFKKHQTIDISKQAIINLLIAELDKKASLFKLSSFMYVPDKIDINLKNDEQLIHENLNFLTPPGDREEIREKFKILDDIYHKVLLIQYIQKSSQNIDKTILNNRDKLEDALKDKKDDLLKIKQLKYKPITNKPIADLSDEEKRLYIQKGGYFHFLEFDLIDEKDRRYNDLSYGEQNIFGQLLNIYFCIKHNNNLIFLLDEPDLSLHPNWQKNYLNEVITLVKKLKKKVHFIFTTHSPFLLSDMPKQNIIFLDTDKEDKCKVVDGLHEKKQTFGANIHTLLSDSFFMEDGLMGEFAKGKIDKAFKLLNKDNLTEDEQKYCEEIISIIGEPIIKNQLQKMLNNKRLSKVDKIDELQKQIEELQNEVDKLKNNE